MRISDVSAYVGSSDLWAVFWASCHKFVIKIRAHMIVNPTCSHRKFAFDSQHLSWRRKLWPARACKQLVDGGHFLIKCIESHGEVAARGQGRGDRKSTRMNSSH